MGERRSLRRPQPHRQRDGAEASATCLLPLPGPLPFRSPAPHQRRQHKIRPHALRSDRHRHVRHRSHDPRFGGHLRGRLEREAPRLLSGPRPRRFQPRRQHRRLERQLPQRELRHGASGGRRLDRPEQLGNRLGRQRILLCLLPQQGHLPRHRLHRGGDRQLRQYLPVRSPGRLRYRRVRLGNRLVRQCLPGRGQRSRLRAVSFYNNGASADYEIAVYTGLPAEPVSPGQGVPAGTTVGSLDHSGYVTVPLDSPTYTALGDYFSVVVRLTSHGYEYPITVERPIRGCSSNATASAGQSYISRNGTAWTDLTTGYSNANVCLKAFTDDAAGTRYFVTEDGSGDGSSWENASSDLAGILQKAISGDEVWVAEGTYSPTDVEGAPTSNDRAIAFEIKEGVSLYGGFPNRGGDMGNRSVSNYETILTGNIGTKEESSDNSYHVVTIDDPDTSSQDHDGTVVLDGFTIRDGYADLDSSEYYKIGAGIHITYMSTVTIKNCVFKNNHATYLGGGLSAYRSNLTLEQCTFEENNAFHGGGVLVSHCYTADFSGCVFIGNTADESGGGLLDNDSNLVLEDCTFHTNRAQSGDGGGVAFHVKDNHPENEAGPVIRRCTFLDNQAAVGGGALCCKDKDATITNNVFDGNKAGAAGAVYNYQCSPVINYCKFLNNEALQGGGAVVNSGSAAQISNSLFENNTAHTRSGGAIGNWYDSDTVIEDCYFVGNSAGKLAGAISNVPASDSTIRRCLFENNHATNDGGAIAAYRDEDPTPSNPTIVNCTFYGNSASRRGGAVHAREGSETTIKNCTFVGNAASQEGNSIYAESSTVTTTNSILWDEAADLITLSDDQGSTADYCVLNMSTPNIFGDHNTNADPMLDTLKDNGGPTKTCALLYGSSALDNASNDVAPAMDQRGMQRPWPADGTADIGAYEAQRVIPAPTATPTSVPPTATPTPTTAPTATPTSGPTPTPVPGSEPEDVDSDDVTPDEDSGTVSADVEPMDDGEKEEVQQQVQGLVDSGEINGDVDKTRATTVKTRLEAGTDKTRFTIGNGGGNEMTAQAETRTKVLVKNQGGDWKGFDPDYISEDLDVEETDDGITLSVKDNGDYDLDQVVGTVETDVAIVTYQAATPTGEPSPTGTGDSGGGCSMGPSALALLLLIVPGLLALRR
ncbi:MAG: right-handed parallel beta-helix repeat-containing protein [Synergistales bacterium]|nr:right-handed parallel beta-helix repeat-containing protein [Synergistales bacterium]